MFMLRELSIDHYDSIHRPSVVFRVWRAKPNHVAMKKDGRQRKKVLCRTNKQTNNQNLVQRTVDCLRLLIIVHLMVHPTDQAFLKLWLLAAVVVTV
jgi:hypothetical protein